MKRDIGKETLQALKDIRSLVAEKIELSDEEFEEFSKALTEAETNPKPKPKLKKLLSEPSVFEKTIPFEEVAQKWRADPEFMEEYDALKEEFESIK